jgi:glycosyltransferase involved in cell wall biosynthesis
MPDTTILGNRMAALKCCVLIPTYNNAKTLENVIQSVLEFTSDLIIVNDGASDGTSEILKKFNALQILHHPQNLGKGMALRNGFELARKLGYIYCITIDSDGQHQASDLPKLIDKIEEIPGALVMGARNMDQASVPEKSSFGHKFSNFWFRFETGINLPDTQTGYRLYPLDKIKHIGFFTNKFEFEIEVIVKAAWRNIPIVSVPVSVYYAPKEIRISHFRPVPDFLRVSLLNTYLVILAILWYIPIRFLKSLTPKNLLNFVRTQFLNSNETSIQKSIAIGFGVFMGIVPIWGFQLLVGITLCHFLKLNKAIFITAAHISVAPMIPFIVYFSFYTGGLVLDEPSTLKEFTNVLSLESTKQNFYQYLVGSMVLAVISGLFFGLFSYFCMLLFRKKKR